MSRQDGTFPSRKDMDLNPDNPPDYSTSKRCANVNCNLRWPNHDSVKECPACGCLNLVIDGTAEPDFTWAFAISKIKHYWFEKWYLKYDGDVNDDVFPWITDPLPISEKELEAGKKDIEKLLREIEDASEDKG